MKTADHNLIGLKLIEGMSNRMTVFQRNLFLIGCVEPDYNVFTYFRGCSRLKNVKGHNYENTKEVVRDYLYRLSNTRKWSIFTYYTFGKLIHYIADAFTFSHNANFEGSIIEHVEYEERLHAELLNSCVFKQLGMLNRHRKSAGDAIFLEFLKEHERYLETRDEMEKDLLFICGNCQKISSELMPEVYEQQCVCL